MHLNDHLSVIRESVFFSPRQHNGTMEWCVGARMLFFANVVGHEHLNAHLTHLIVEEYVNGGQYLPSANRP